MGQAARYSLPPVLLKYRDQKLVIITQLATGIVHLHRDLPKRVGVGKADAPKASRSQSVPKATRREGGSLLQFLKQLRQNHIRKQKPIGIA